MTPAPATAAVLAGLVVEQLGAAAVSHVVLCPGSRSAPLAYALDAVAHRGSGSGLGSGSGSGAGQSAGPRLLVRIDERVAGFTALGIGRAGGLAAVVTTSGTAVANLHPAVLEAHHGGVPLVVVAADRPPRLRGTWANQTSELQAHLFGDALRALLDLDDETAATDPAAARLRLRTTLAAATGVLPDGRVGRPGPVQLNVGLSDPLLPAADAVVTWGRRPTPASSGPGAPTATADPSPLVLARGPRTVVVAGDGTPSDGSAALALAAATGWPLLAEPTSHARGGPHAVGPYRLLLEHPDLCGQVERVVVTGRPTLSRPVGRLLADPAVELVLVSEHDDWPDPGRAVVRAHRVVPAAAAAGPDGGADAVRADLEWAQRWRRADDAARPAVDRVLATAVAGGQLTGPLLAREVAAAIGPGQVLVVGSSNPVRDLDLAAHPHPDRALSALTNRGLSGIDGTVATATGVALQHPGPVRVLLGDLAFLHDVGALLADPGDLADARARHGVARDVAAQDGASSRPVPVSRPWLQVVVLDDGGGGIFSMLEYGRRGADSEAEAARFERLFGTPHQVDLAALCAGYGVPLQTVRGLDELRAALADPPPGTSVLVVPADRAGLRPMHDAIRAAVTAAISSASIA